MTCSVFSYWQVWDGRWWWWKEFYHFLWFKVCPSSHLGPRVDATLVLGVLERLHWLVQYHDKRILFYWIPSHVGIRGNEKADAAAKAGLLRRVTHIPIPYGVFKQHINGLSKRKWQSYYRKKQSTTNYKKFFLSWVCGLKISESLEHIGFLTTNVKWIPTQVWYWAPNNELCQKYC